MSLVIIKGGPGSGHHGHAGRPGKRGGSAPGSSRAWTGEQVPRAKDGSRISKLHTGELGEMYAKQALAEKYGVPFVELNQGINNAPIDVAGDHHAVEVKAGLNTNGKTAQHWRATIGQPGKEERALISKMTSKEKRAHNVAKEQAILARKNSMLSEMSEAAGTTIKPATVGVILSEDGSQGDVFMVPGFHLRLTWDKYATDDYYLGTYDIDTIQKGGPGSGHHGHAGRPGKRGGSLPGGGSGDKALLDMMISDDIQRIGGAGAEGVSDTYLGQLSDGTKVVVKSQSVFGDAKNEALIYEMTQEFSELGMNGAVPPTVLREDGSSVQLYLSGSSIAYEANWNSVDESEYKKMIMFDVLTGYGDRHGGNFMISPTGRISVIDNDQAFNPYSAVPASTIRVPVAIFNSRSVHGNNIKFTAADTEPFTNIQNNEKFRGWISQNIGEEQLSLVDTRLNYLRRMTADGDWSP